MFWFLLLVSGCSTPPTTPTPTASPAADLQPTLTPSPAPVLGTPLQPLPPSIAFTPFPTPTPTPAPTATSTPVQSEVVPVQFAPGQIQATFEIGQGEAKRYVLHALAGQIMHVVVDPGPGSLRIYGEDGTDFGYPDGEFSFFWRGELQSTQDYFIDVMDGPLRLSVLIVPPGQSSLWQVYRDEANGFELSYSDYFAVVKPPFLYEKSELALTFAGSEYFLNTNLHSVLLTVDKLEQGQTDAGCPSIDHPPLVQPVDHIEIHGVTFERAVQENGGAGNVWDDFIHQTLHNNACYQINFAVHSHRVGNYDPSLKIVEFDHEGVLGHLQGVLDTFRFIGS